LIRRPSVFTSPRCKLVSDQASIFLGNWSSVYAPTADGQRFLVATTFEQQSISPVTVVINWPADLKP
jgi:hypothetical protein